MLQDIRSNIQGTIAKIIIGLIVVSFSIFGIESLLFSGGSSAVAEVNDDEITPFELQQELSIQQRQLLSMLGENADPALLDETLLTEQALQTLIERSVVRQAAEREGIVVADAAIAEIIGSMGQFQIDGEFSVDLFQSALASAGFTPAMFRQRLSEDLLQGQLLAGLAGSALVTETELAAAARVEEEARDLRYLTLPLERYRDEAVVTDEEIQAYYEANAARFLSEESLDVEYLELTLDGYREPVAAERVREEFELVKDQYEQSTEARVSHILFEGDEQAERLAAAQAAIAGGMSFEEAAAEYSDDVGSASSGGDLGYTAGDAFPEPMEELIADLGVGESGSVETEAGTHLVLVTDRRAGSSVTFEEVRAELAQRMQDDDAAAALLRDVERLRDVAFNAADLSEPARELGLEVQRVADVTRDSGDGPLSEARLRRAVFSEDVLEAGHNSEVIELSPQRFAVVRVAERKPPAQQPLVAVRGRIERILRDEKASADAAATAEALAARVRDGERLEDVANEQSIEWQVELGAKRPGERLPAALRAAVFTLPAPRDGETNVSRVEGPEALYVVQLVRVSPGSLEALSGPERAELRRSLESEAAALVQEQYLAALRRSADITVY